jgi:hypothetical protein
VSTLLLHNHWQLVLDRQAELVLLGDMACDVRESLVDFAEAV